MSDILDVIMQEKRFLRDELRHLKDCQLRYIVLAVGGTGAFFALISANVFDGTNNNMHWLSGVIFLTPLLFILPCAYIFFDKARSLSRMVGYFRLLEAWCWKYRDKAEQEYVGWETQLRRWRDRVAADKNSKTILNTKVAKGRAAFASALRGATFKNRYWFMIYRIFWIMAVGLVTVQIVETISTIKFWLNAYSMYGMAPIAVSMLSIIFAGYLIWFTFNRLAVILLELVEGEKSYDSNERRWWELHGVVGEELNKRLE